MGCGEVTFSSPASAGKGQGKRGWEAKTPGGEGPDHTHQRDYSRSSCRAADL